MPNGGVDQIGRVRHASQVPHLRRRNLLLHRRRLLPAHHLEQVSIPERDFFFENLLVRVHPRDDLVDRPCTGDDFCLRTTGVRCTPLL